MDETFWGVGSDAVKRYLGVTPTWMLGETGNPALKADPRIPSNPKADLYVNLHKDLSLQNVQPVSLFIMSIKFVVPAPQPFCGDSTVGSGSEECDCGTIFQCVAARSCCVPPEGKGSKQPCTWDTSLKECVRT